MKDFPGTLRGSPHGRMHSQRLTFGRLRLSLNAVAQSFFAQLEMIAK